VTKLAVLINVHCCTFLIAV